VIAVKVIHHALPPEVLARVQARARESLYGTREYGGLTFPGMSVVESTLVPEVGALLGMRRPPVLCYFRVGNTEDEHTSFIHTDVGVGSLATILYLDSSDADGTAFWIHRRTWKDSTVGETPEERTQHQHDQLSAEAWIRYETVTMRENRLVVFPTVLFHSRFPFHPTFANRRVFVSFFDEGAL